MRIPRPCRFVARRGVFRGQFGIGETLAGNLAHCHLEALGIVHVFAIVEPEHLFVKVAEKMKRLYRNICSMQSALEQAPEVLKGVRGYATINVLNGMVHDLMLVFGIQSTICAMCIGVESRASLNVFTNFRLQRGS